MIEGRNKNEMKTHRLGSWSNLQNACASCAPFDDSITTKT
jgi:hypothetical protein